MFESEDKLSEEEKFEAELLYEREMNGWYDYDFDSQSRFMGRNTSSHFSFDNSGLLPTSNVARLFPPDFAFNHPAAAAFNKAFRNSNYGSDVMMNAPPLPNIPHISYVFS